jgi:hypothetical protein
LLSDTAIVVGRVDVRREQKKGRGRPFFSEKKGDLFLVFAINRKSAIRMAQKIQNSQ